MKPPKRCSFSVTVFRISVTSVRTIDLFRQCIKSFEHGDCTCHSFVSTTESAHKCVCVCVCVCERERERERFRLTEHLIQISRCW